MIMLIQNFKKNNIKLINYCNSKCSFCCGTCYVYDLNVYQKGITQYDKMVRSGEFRKAVNQLTTFELLNKEILIIGFGRIGKILIKRCLVLK